MIKYITFGWFVFMSKISKFMMNSKSLFVLFFLMATTHQYAQYTDVINSNRPGKSVSAYSVGKTVFQAEGGLYGIHEQHDLKKYEANGFGTELSLRYGAFFEQLEFNLDTQYQYDWYQAPMINDTRGGFKQFLIGAKYLVFEPLAHHKEKVNVYSWKANYKFNWRQFIPSVAVYGGLNLRFGTNPYTFPGDPMLSPKVMVITQNQFGSKWVFVTNFIADKFTTKFPSSAIIATMTRGFNMRWSGFAEIQGYNSKFYSDTVFRLGMAYLVRENIQIDASVAKNIKDTPAILYGNVGLSWRFDSDYEPVYVKVKEDKKKEEKGKKSKADKGKKRKDAVELEKTR
jgi:hypothetical protein